MVEFDLQRALTDMETRIRQDIAAVGTLARQDAQAARAVADEATIANTELGGRVTSLEEKSKWIFSGIGTLLLSMLGFIWHIITSRV